MKRRFITILSITAILIIGLVWHGVQKHSKHSKSQRSGAVSVVAAPVKVMSFPIMVKSVGTLQAKKAIDVSSPLAGFAVSVNYQPGSFVTAGTPLIQLDSRNYQSKLDSDKADVHLKKLQYAREKWAFGKGAVAAADLDLAQANYQEALATLATDQTTFNETTIRAAFSGYVGAKTVNVGNYLQIGQVLTTLTDRSHLLVNYSFPEQYLNQLKLGQKIAIQPDGQSGKTYEGRVTYISPTVDTSTHSVALQADIPNLNNALSPGLFVRITQNLGEISGAIVIPEEAIVPTITGSEVYVIRNNKAYSVQVETGSEYQNKVQITKGLKMGDRVITVGQSEVQSGSKIHEVK